MTQAQTIDAPGLRSVQRRTVATLSFAQMLSGVAVAGSLPAGALIAAGLGGEGAAGLAQTAGVFGAALLALPLARVALVKGRRRALSTGYAIGALGAVIVVFAGVGRSLPLALLGCLLLGVATAAGYQSRYAATDLAPEDKRGGALAIVVWAGTVGAVLGPNLLQFSGDRAMSAGLPQLTGPFVLAFLTLSVAALTLVVALRPDPYLLARSLADGGEQEHPRLRDGLAHLRRHRPALLGMTAVAVGHVAMVMVMVMTPVHMSHVDVSLRLIGLVISVHVIGMYAFSPIVGWAVDRWGRIQVIVTGAVILLAACVVSGMAPADDVRTLGAGLFLLGLGWSCTLIAGSTLLTDDVEPAERPSVQGLSDLMMNVAGALGGAVAGLVVMTSSYGVLCGVASVPVFAMLALVPVLGRHR